MANTIPVHEMDREPTGVKSPQEHWICCPDEVRSFVVAQLNKAGVPILRTFVDHDRCRTEFLLGMDLNRFYRTGRGDETIHLTWTTGQRWCVLETRDSPAPERREVQGHWTGSEPRFVGHIFRTQIFLHPSFEEARRYCRDRQYDFAARPGRQPREEDARGIDRLHVGPQQLEYIRLTWRDFREVETLDVAEGVCANNNRESGEPTPSVKSAYPGLEHAGTAYGARVFVGDRLPGHSTASTAESAREDGALGKRLRHGAYRETGECFVSRKALAELDKWVTWDARHQFNIGLIRVFKSRNGYTPPEPERTLRHTQSAGLVEALQKEMPNGGTLHCIDYDCERLRKMVTGERVIVADKLYGKCHVCKKELTDLADCNTWCGENESREYCNEHNPKSDPFAKTYGGVPRVVEVLYCNKWVRAEYYTTESGRHYWEPKGFKGAFALVDGQNDFRWQWRPLQVAEDRRLPDEAVEPADPYVGLGFHGQLHPKPEKPKPAGPVVEVDERGRVALHLERWDGTFEHLYAGATEIGRRRVAPGCTHADTANLRATISDAAKAAGMGWPLREDGYHLTAIRTAHRELCVAQCKAEIPF